MRVKLMALYRDWLSADAVVEALLNHGFVHRNIELKSGHAWLDSSSSETGNHLGVGMRLDGSETVIEVHAPDEPTAELAQGVLFDSKAMGIRRHAGDREETWLSFPITVAVLQSISWTD